MQRSVILTLTNLRGIPYKFDFEGTRATNYQMRLHSDFMHFALSPGEERRPPVFEPRWLRMRHYDRHGWELLRQAALATSAFPFGLASQPLHRKVLEYADRQPNPFAIHDVSRRAKPSPIPPYWPDAMPDDYDFLCVDGGVIDNEPLELARRVLLGEHAKGKVGPEDADHALMMVDPFPSAVTFPVEYRAHHVGSSRDFSLARLALAFTQCLMNQARFKPEELEEAVAPANCSRYLLEPIRYDPDTGEQQQYAIACGSVDGFGEVDP